MMTLFRTIRQWASHFTLFDWIIVKIDLIIIGLLLAKLFPVLISLHRGWYVGCIIVAEIYFVSRIMKFNK